MSKFETYRSVPFMHVINCNLYIETAYIQYCELLQVALRLLHLIFNTDQGSDLIDHYIFDTPVRPVAFFYVLIITDVNFQM